MRRLFITFILFGIVLTSAHAQLNTQWKQKRINLIFGIGGTSFLGDLGGADQIGTHLAKDFEISYTRPAFHVGYRYKLSPPFAVKATLSYGWVYGDDATTNEISRNARNLSFRSPILEFGGNFEYHLIREKYGHHYELRGMHGRINIPSFYLFTGINGFYFNPKAKYEGKWVALQPLSTEGQGIVATRDKYARISLSVPLGFGMNFLVDRDWGIGFELGVRYSMTDYIDDVSTTYVDPDLFIDPVAQALADRSDNWSGSGVYDQRGNSHYNDAYVFMTINLTYVMRPRGGIMVKF